MMWIIPQENGRKKIKQKKLNKKSVNFRDGPLNFSQVISGHFCMIKFEDRSIPRMQDVADWILLWNTLGINTYWKVKKAVLGKVRNLKVTPSTQRHEHHDLQGGWEREWPCRIVPNWHRGSSFYDLTFSITECFQRLGFHLQLPIVGEMSTSFLKLIDVEINSHMLTKINLKLNSKVRTNSEQMIQNILIQSYLMTLLN